MATHSQPPLFKEEQRFRHPLLWIPLLGGLGFALREVVRQAGSATTGALPEALIGGGVLLAVLAFFWWLRLETRLDPSGVHLRFVPLHPTGRTIPWSDVERAWIRSYHPLREFGGWGVRLGRGGRAYNVRGSTGLQLVLRDGSRILVGTNRVPQLRVVLAGLVARGVVDRGGAEEP